MAALDLFQDISARTTGATITTIEGVGGNLGTAISQMKLLIKEAAKDLLLKEPWVADASGLVREGTFPSLATQEQTNMIDLSEFSHFVPGTDIWDATDSRIISGPCDHAKWMWLKSNVTNSIQRYWIRLNGLINIFPVMPAGHTLNFMWVSKGWVREGGGNSTTYVDEITYNADEFRIDQHLLYLAAVMKWRASKKLDYVDELAAFESYRVNYTQAQRGGSQLITTEPREDYSLDPRSGDVWPGTVTG